ncbi:uncharacterized protein LOC111341903 [Stylophora pistillata]|uniref:uncharacterized protein LOC111341903 n=1 Tax=Stylophora pistillata TaxID=50429 RepID=UPI000C0476FA|nr:uncharacterized protein LOC111341903 [Stylophora pistillata]
MAASQDVETTEEPSDPKDKSSYHCQCVPLCNGDSRYHPELKFHRLPGRLTSSTRVCSRHFTEQNYNPPTESGRQLLKREAVPSKFNWSTESKSRRRIIRHVDK